MKKLLVFLAAACLPSFAATLTVPNNAALQSTINSAANGDTVLLPAGQYSGSISVPCNKNLTITGPVATSATAIMQGSFNLAGCTGTTISYMEFVGGGIYLAPGNSSGVTITHNQFAAVTGRAINFDGNLNTTISNTVIEYNVFGDGNSCTSEFATTTDQGGNCAGFINNAGTFAHASIRHNVFNHVEEGAHLLQTGYKNGSPEYVMNDVAIEYNYFVNWHRIAVEVQPGVIGSAVSISHNVFADPLNPSYGTMFISAACCQFGATFGSPAPNPPLHVDDNVLFTRFPQTVGQFHAPVIGVELWGGAGTTGNNNVIGGGLSNDFNWGFSNGTPWFIQGNYLCAPYNGTYIVKEETGQAPVGADGSGNTLSPTCVQQASATPTITVGNAVTMSAAGNTSIWYTTDGSNPVPGVSQLYSGPITPTSSATFKAVGMWGTGPQPASHPAPYGYKPSAVVSAIYSAGIAPVIPPVIPPVVPPTSFTIPIGNYTLTINASGVTITPAP